jgi:hypothetical protein
MVSFEVARRYRFNRELETLDEHVQVHVLPTGKPPGRFNDPTKLRYNYDRAIQTHVDAAERATIDFLATSNR